MKRGDVVVYVDPRGIEHNALVTEVWGETTINIVVVSKDETKHDSYGLQLERHTSLVHQSMTQAAGQMWYNPAIEKLK